MEKKIVIDGRLLSGHPTGISRYTEQLIKAFIKKYGKEKISVIVNHEYSGAEDYHLIHTRYKPYHPLHFLLFSFFVNKLNFSIYYSPFYSGIYFKKDQRKQVITVHDLMYLRIKNYFSGSSLKNSLSRFVFNLLVRLTLKASNLVISVSETTRKDLRELFGRDSVVVGEGVNELREKGDGREEKGDGRRETDWREERDDCTTARLNEAYEDGYFLYVGNFRKQKNVDFLIEAFLKSNTPYWLVLAGSTASRRHDVTTSRGKEKRKGESEKRTSSNETPSHLLTFSPSQLQENKVIFTGALEDAEISYLYKNCVAFVLPSLYEGFGLPILEAYCAGARVFSSNAGALKEFEQLNIHYFSPDKQEELVSLLERADQFSKPAEAQIKEARENYCWEKQMGKLVDIVDSVMC